MAFAAVGNEGRVDGRVAIEDVGALELVDIDVQRIDEGWDNFEYFLCNGQLPVK